MYNKLFITILMATIKLCYRQLTNWSVNLHCCRHQIYNCLARHGCGPILDIYPCYPLMFQMFDWRQFFFLFVFSFSYGNDILFCFVSWLWHKISQKCLCYVPLNGRKMRSLLFFTISTWVFSKLPPILNMIVISTLHI